MQTDRFCSKPSTEEDHFKQGNPNAKKTYINRISFRCFLANCLLWWTSVWGIHVGMFLLISANLRLIRVAPAPVPSKQKQHGSKYHSLHQMKISRQLCRPCSHCHCRVRYDRTPSLAAYVVFYLRKNLGGDQGIPGWLGYKGDYATQLI